MYTPGHHYIASQWIKGCGTPFVSTNPANGETLWQGNVATVNEVQDAVRVAQRAQGPWSALSIKERATYLQAFASQVAHHRDTLATRIAQETGKPFWEALTEVSAVIGKIAISIAAYDDRTPDNITTTAEGNSGIHYKPHGVVAVLGAFNFPAHLSNGHIVPALLAGNTVVYKPSELTPAVAEMILQCWDAAKLPAGVMNCIQGDANTGQNLLAQDIQGVYFTGSYQTGKKIHAFFSGKPEVILALEMGGNNPLVVTEVNELDTAIYITLVSTLITAGQRCTCARRVFIPDTPWGDRFLEQFITACQRIQIGAYTERPEPFMGPVIRYEHARSHLQKYQALLTQGGVSLLPLSLLKENTGFLSPGIIDMTQATNAPDEEIFAPLVQIYRPKNFHDALDQANHTRYGLVAGLISDNPQQYQAFYQTVRAGLMNWNKPTTGASSQLPFGGIGISGNHRPSAYFAADYCAYPVASQEAIKLKPLEEKLPGIS